MTCVFDNPEEFAKTALAGFASVYSRTVRPVIGGVVRSTATPAGKVAVIVGGGSGHYPAFAGFVGPGLADAAVAGDVFASPSTHLVANVCRKAHRGGGVRTVAVAINTWPVHESALEWGLREAKLRNARLRVVHVVPETLGVEGAQFVSAASAGLGEQLAPFRAAHPDVPIEVEVLLGDPADALVEVSRSVDLLILGERHRRLVLGGPVRAVLAHAHCPVGLIR